MGKHKNIPAIGRIEKRLGVKERNVGVDFKKGQNLYEYAETVEDIKSSILQLQEEEAIGSKRLIVPDSLSGKAISLTEGTEIGVENISGTIKKRSKRKR